MSIKKAVCFRQIKNFQLRELFNQLGWNHTTRKEQFQVDGQVYQLEAIAEKSAFHVFVCETPGKVPDYATRKKIDTAVTKIFNQHLNIFIDSTRKQQVWQLVVKELDKPSVVRETTFHAHQDPELLFQKLQHLFFSIDEEDNITVVDVTGRVQTGFNTNAEKVTKKFYEGFKKEHSAFLAFIKGISTSQDKDWYASLMLNRLMFIYFIQKKGFLNNDKFYLKTKLAETQSRKGKDKFYSFYRNFLLVLFHHGLGSPDNRKFESELGKVPYLNGGLFDVHELETTYTEIQIEDKAFQRIFDFFDQYEWHLDTRQQATGKEINPDVIGYIFEKYINDRAAMGAYYTKEDITDYIGKNCIIPFLFDELKRNYPAALKKRGEIWSLLQQHPADYIYPAVQHGIEKKLPPEIAVGFKDVSKRTEWNKPAPSEFALPTEIWREVVERRRRHDEVKGKIEAGEIHEINDLITYNLNITKFAIDIIQNSSDPELIRHFYKALIKITVLDPTCGSGAFLFAAMNILEPLYESCIGRMRAFVDEDGGKFKSFDEILKRVDSPEHPNLQYFIFKSIILNNLYGVDIMKEAIEIAKLRLFLKLVATVDVDYKKPNMGLEPLPDIDFNIRSGNTLVGFVSVDDVKKAVEGQLGFHDKDIASIEEAADYVKRAFSAFREAQIDNDTTKKGAKKQLNERLQKLNDRLDVYLGKLYGKDPKKAAEYKAWHDSHMPFHWFAEFYEIIHDRGGFDVIIGNPPYLEQREVKYTIKGFITAESGAIHSMCIERSFSITNQHACISMIVPLALVSTQRMFSTQNVIEANSSAWYSNFSWRPGKLFDTVNRALTIFISRKSDETRLYSTNYKKWNAHSREDLMNLICYCDIPRHRYAFWRPKLGYTIETNILQKLVSSNSILGKFYGKSDNRVYYRTTGGLYWKIFTDFAPKFYINGKKGHSSRETWFTLSSDNYVKSAVAVLSSDLFWWWYTVTSNLRDLNPYDIQNFPCIENVLSDKKLQNLGEKYLDDLELNSVMLERQQKTTGTTKTQSFKIQKSKSIIDQIDSILAKHYGFTDEELDFIINYDIKYRMGLGGSDDEDAE